MNILILGAAGQIARVATRELLARTDATLTLYARKAHRLSPAAPPHPDRRGRCA